MQGRPHILLVEDEDNIAIALKVLLGREGFDVTRVASGDQAMPNLRARRPDLVILDVSLPGRSGYEVCQDIRNDAAYADLPVLMMSARASEVEQRKGRALGANDFLTKPFAVADLRTKVADLIKGARHEH